MALGLSNFRLGLPFTEMGRCASVHLSLPEDIRTYIWANVKSEGSIRHHNGDGEEVVRYECQFQDRSLTELE